MEIFLETNMADGEKFQDLCEDEFDENALRAAALQTLQKPKYINKNNLIAINANQFFGTEEAAVKLEPISPSREQKFIDEKRIRLEKQENEAKDKTEDKNYNEDEESLDGLIDMLQATIDGKDTKKSNSRNSEDEEVEFLDVRTNRRAALSKDVIVLNSPSVSPRPTYRSRSRSRRRSWTRSWSRSRSRSPRQKRYSPLRSVSPRYRRRRSKSWSPSPSRSPKQRPRSPYRSPRRWSRSPRRRRSRTPLPRKRSLSPRRSPRRRSRTQTRTPPRLRSRSPINRARKRESPVRRRSLSPRRRQRPLRRSEDKEKKPKNDEPLDPVLEARRRKFQSLPNTNKKISLKAVKDTIEPVSETGVDIRLGVLSDESEDSDGQEGRFKSNSQPQARGKLLSFRSIREGTAVAPPARLEPVANHRSMRADKPERIRLKKRVEKRHTSPHVPLPVKSVNINENTEKKVNAVAPVKKQEPKDSLAAPEVELRTDAEKESDLRTLLSKKRKDRVVSSGLLPLNSRLVQSALLNLGEVREKHKRRVLVVENLRPVSGQPQPRAGPKRRVRKVQDLEPTTTLLSEDSEPDEPVHRRKLKVKRSVTIASQVTN